MRPNSRQNLYLQKCRPLSLLQLALRYYFFPLTSSLLEILSLLEIFFMIPFCSPDLSLILP